MFEMPKPRPKGLKICQLFIVRPADRSWPSKINGISFGGKSPWKYWENSSQKPPQHINS